ncbi:MAG: FAD:protein FMN transferase, partial [Oscillospiraceae bacterium]|nr:FAD:protein FMN transferase [Oscillospiraceae bacterium]
MKAFVSLVLAFCLVLGGCISPKPPEEKRYTETFLSLFDTVTTIVGCAESEEAFQQTVQKIHDQLQV